MKGGNLLKYSEYILVGLFISGLFVFFAFFYRHHLHFAEQIQLFLLTGSYFISKISVNGGLTGYLGEFLTQFYYLPIAGPLILTLLLLSVQQVVKRILKSVSTDGALLPLSCIPAIFAALLMCNEFYPLSAVTGYLTGLLAGWLYVSINNGNKRFYTGLILIPATYWLAGGSYLMLISIMMAYEITGVLKQKVVISRFIIRYILLYPAIALAIPFLVKRFLIMQPLMPAFLSEYYYNILTVVPAGIPVLFVMPALLMLAVFFIRIREKLMIPAFAVQFAGLILFALTGLRLSANFSAESIMKYDYLVRNERWNDVIKLAEKDPPRNWLSLSMLNLSLAKTGQLGNKMFNYGQRGVNGLFLPFAREYVAPMMGNEIFYHLSLTNASQQYAFESMETIPNHNKSARMIKRLAETNLINGNYGVAEKYLRLLEKTIFYRKWARDTRPFLFDDKRIASHPAYGEKRRFAVRNDYFFHVLNMEAVLHRMIKENPDNRMAFEYLMAFYLVNKDLRNFAGLVPSLEKMNYREIPLSYQEAMLYIIGLTTTDPFTAAPPYINAGVRNRMRSYADIYRKSPDPEARLRRDYSDTYWYFFHFAGVEGQHQDDKTY